MDELVHLRRRSIASDPFVMASGLVALLTILFYAAPNVSESSSP